MKSNALQHFLEVAKAGSFRRAGKSLRIAASALNRQISLLEADLSAPLFERGRGRNQLRLTPAGEILAQHARSVINQVDQARYEIEALKGLRAGRISVGAPDAFSREFLPQFMAEFKAAYPQISFQLMLANKGQGVDLLIRDEIEFAFLYQPTVPPSLEAVASLERERYLMASPGHPLAGRPWVRLSDIAKYPLVVPDQGFGSRELYDQIFAKLGIKPNISVVAQSYEMLRSAAHVGLGLAIVTDYLMPLHRDPSAEFVLVRIRDAIVKPQTLWCCVRRGRKLSVAARTFAERVKVKFSALQKQSKGRVQA